MEASTGEAAGPGAAEAIRARLRALSENASLLVTDAFRARSEALDLLESGVLALLPHPFPGWEQGAAAKSPLASVLEDAERLRERWETLDDRFFRGLRAKLLAAPDPGATFREMLESHFPARERSGSASPAGYDALDAFLNGLLHPWPIPSGSRPLEPGMVAFQKTPGRVALELLASARLSPVEVFCDVGSGLGQIPILAHLLTGARAIGIERETAYADYARACAAGLGLADVEFFAGDAREAEFGRFDVLFFYTPFRGPILDEVLGRVRRLAREGSRIFAFGPCAADFASRDWLVPMEPDPGWGPELRGFVLRGAGARAG